jgi:hypothetical protein
MTQQYPGALMTVLLPFALGLHAQIFEMYLQDLEVVDDAADTSYAMYGQAYQQAFQQVVAIVGAANGTGTVSGNRVLSA